MNKFKIWVEDENIDNTQTYSDFEIDSQREAGFQSGTPASAKRVNTALRQANLIGCALMDVVAPNNEVLNFRSKREDVTEVIKQKLIKYQKLNSKTYEMTVQGGGKRRVEIEIPGKDIMFQENKHYKFVGKRSYTYISAGNTEFVEEMFDVDIILGRRSILTIEGYEDYGIKANSHSINGFHRIYASSSESSMSISGSFSLSAMLYNPYIVEVNAAKDTAYTTEFVLHLPSKPLPMAIDTSGYDYYGIFPEGLVLQITDIYEVTY